MIEETVRRSPAPSQSPLRSTRRTAGSHPLGTAPSAPVRDDARGQEGQEFLGLLHEAGAVTVEQRYARGEVIFAEGDPGNALYVLTEGAVKLSRDYSGGKEATLMLLGPWEVFGELAFGYRICGVFRLSMSHKISQLVRLICGMRASNTGAVYLRGSVPAHLSAAS